MRWLFQFHLVSLQELELLQQKGVLVKGSNYLELISKCDTVVFDKTGTLTKGVFKVSKINANVDEKKFLEMAVVAEMYSNHPIANH